MRMYDEFRSTTNSRIYKIMKKQLWSKKTGGCVFCPYHRVENARWNGTQLRNWKRYRKTQYRIK